MEVTEAPEKIYIFDNPILDFMKLSVKQNDNDIEYIRTDVFIEKACEWLKNNIDSYYVTNEFEQWFDEMFEDFKEAMKGD